jgi:hypothetical protein
MKSKRTVGRHLRSISGLSKVLGDRLRSAALSPQMHFANNSLSRTAIFGVTGPPI